MQLESAVAREKMSTVRKALIGGGALVLVLALVLGIVLRPADQTAAKTDVRGQDTGGNVEYTGFRKGTVAANAFTSDEDREFQGKASGVTYKDADDKGSSMPPEVYPQASGGGRAAPAPRRVTSRTTERAMCPRPHGRRVRRGAEPRQLPERLRGPAVDVGDRVRRRAEWPCGRCEREHEPGERSGEPCIRGRVFGMSFPSHPRLDVTTTSFAAQ